MPTCFVTHLKIIEIYEFHEDEEEMHAAKIFLESASVYSFGEDCHRL